MEDLNVQTIAIPVEEYKELIQKQAELSLIYHKGAGGSVYDIGNFVLDLMLAVHAPPEVVDGKPPIYPYTPIKSSFEDAGSVEEMMLYTELQSAVHAMIQRLEYSFTFNPSLLTSPKRKQQVSEILAEAEKYIWRIREEMQCD